MPTSCTFSPSLDVKGLAVAGPAAVFLDKSSFLGRCLGAGRSGDLGSFLTIILGPGPRELGGGGS